MILHPALIEPSDKHKGIWSSARKDNTITNKDGILETILYCRGFGLTEHSIRFAGFLLSGSFIRRAGDKFHDILILNVVWFLSRWNLARDIVRRMSLYMFDDQYQYINRNGFPNEFSFWDHMFPTLSQHCFITCQSPCQAVNRHKVTSTLWGAWGMHLPWENDGFRVNLGKAISCLAKRCG